MDTEQRTVIYDDDLKLEAYRFRGLKQKFPAHFHDYYVIGLIENGRRTLTVNNRELTIGPGAILLFNPNDSHACIQHDHKELSYRNLNIKSEIMQGIMYDIDGKTSLPHFAEPVLYHEGYAAELLELHMLIMGNAPAMQKEEKLFLFMEQLLRHAAAYALPAQAAPDAIDAVCRYVEANFTAKIRLDELAAMCGLNKYTFLRNFTKAKGITPYRYLETVRIGKAKELLQQGLSPAATAQATGFADQSHFSVFFKDLIGLTPGQYQAVFRPDRNT